jgi:hypothetical protein
LHDQVNSFTLVSIRTIQFPTAVKFTIPSAHRTEIAMLDHKDFDIDQVTMSTAE